MLLGDLGAEVIKVERPGLLGVVGPITYAVHSVEDTVYHTLCSMCPHNINSRVMHVCFCAYYAQVYVHPCTYKVYVYSGSQKKWDDFECICIMCM